MSSQASMILLSPEFDNWWENTGKQLKNLGIDREVAFKLWREYYPLISKEVYDTAFAEGKRFMRQEP